MTKSDRRFWMFALGFGALWTLSRGGFSLDGYGRMSRRERKGPGPGIYNGIGEVC